MQARYWVSAVVGTALLMLLVLPALAFAADEPGADYPLVGRFQGAEMTRYQTQAFDEYRLIIDAVKNYGGIDKNPDATRTLEGRVIHITYQSPAEDSTLVVFRAYREALAKNGFKLLYECSDADCGGRNFNHASPGVRASYMDFGENYEDQRYLAMHLPRPEGDVYVAVHTALKGSAGGQTRGLIYTQVDVVEMKPRARKVVVIKAEDMAAKIGAEGRIALYGIHFDTDSASIKPESKPTLDQIAKLLTGHPKLKLLVVGHTDNRGALDYNMKLSRDRSAAVVKALVSAYGIDSARLSPHGIAFLAPVATNATQAGRAENRRVELVQRRGSEGDG